MTQRTHAGFTLIEALVALLVLSIGLVGMAALYLTSMRNVHSSYYHSLASTIALDLEERMWERVATELNTAGQCLVQADLDDIEDELEALWKNPPIGQAGIPNLNITFGDIVSDPITRDQWVETGVSGTWTENWVEIPVTLTWTESRFEDAGQLEQFDYIARAPCVSLFTPPAP